MAENQAPGPNRWARGLEWLILYWIMPSLIVADVLPLNPIPILLAVSLLCFGLLWRDRSFDRSKLWRRTAIKPELTRVLSLFGLTVILVTAGVLLFSPQLFLNFVRQAPVVWTMVMLLYPLLSVYPQEVVYRTFFFHRYQALFRSAWVMITMNALAFGYMHIIFENAIAVLMTTIGGALFAWTYHRSRSTAAVWLEHALYGCFIFTVGLGRYFYHGAVN